MVSRMGVIPFLEQSVLCFLRSKKPDRADDEKDNQNEIYKFFKPIKLILVQVRGDQNADNQNEGNQQNQSVAPR
jgi:hypothetical protein